MATSLSFEKDNEVKYKELGSSKRNKVFLTYKSIYITAALIAIKLELEPRPIQNKHDFIKDANLNEDEKIILKYIALNQTQNPMILNNQTEIINVTNELANAGIGELYDVLNRGGDRVYAILDYCQQHFWKPDK